MSLPKILTDPLFSACVILFACGMNSSLFAEGRKATPASSITVQRGFTAERLYSARQGEGSWISMTFDPHGRIVVGRDDVGLGRLTFRESAAEWTYESIETSLRHCRGVLWAHDSLYVSATDTPGLYRLRDLDGDDKLEDIRQLIGLDYRSRYGHGSNQIVSGPDGLIYWVIGNDVSFPEDTSPDSPYRNPQNDHLLPNPHDAGHDNRVGFILRTDPEGRNAVVIAGGFRNQVDMAFNDEGEMFTFDADMEWDVGQPWYRPIRINHIIQGGEYGWRWGTGKWPTYYVDSLPSSQDVGLGSPTGVAFGTLSNFPAAYRRALFVADWQNGRILVARLVPKGCTYGFEYDVFLEGAPLNICDFTFGPDGAMYFITGGRGSQSGLYRVRPTGETTTWGEMTVDQAIQQEAQGARQIRRELERLQFRPTPSAVDILWPHLNSPDSWLRFSARVALERQDVALWARRAITEQQTDGAITALTALARMGNPYHQPDIVRALQTHLSGRLSDDQLVAALRACELTCIRQGRPTDMTCKTLAAQISPLGPHRDPRVNQLMSDLLIYLDPSNAVSKVITLLESATTQEEQIYYADRLSRHRYGWTSESRKAMLIWLARAHTMRGGRLLKTNLQHIRDDFVAGLNDIEREELKFLMAKLMEPSESTPVVPVRPFIKHWTIEELLPVVETALDEASPDRGKERIKEASCFRCHSMEGLGTPIGPDLTHLGRRDDTRSILQSLVTPSLEIDAKYRSATYELDSGRLVTGQVVSVNGSELTIETDVVSGATETLARDAILTSYPSNVSPMPSGLLDSFTAAEIADMVAYLRRPR